MDHTLPLFSEEQAGDPTFSVMELNRAIEAALSAKFPREVWVRGEIQGLSRTRMRRHWYFELVEKQVGADGGVRARLSIALLGWNRDAVDRALVENPGFALDDGIEVRLRGRVGFYPPFGKLQLEMTGVDPAYTLGQLAANRDRILRTLAAEKLLERNARLVFPVVPVRIGLITSAGSAAYNDFVRELEHSGFGFRIQLIDARVQGPEAAPTLLAALARFRKLNPDVVAIVRGGGSTSDLAAFDSERIARAIAAMPCPVITGIGHEIDKSVADHVAHTSYKTPTACAAALVDRTRAFVQAVEESWGTIAELALEHLDEQGERLVEMASSGARSARGAVERGERDLRESRRRLWRGAPQSLDRSRMRLLHRAGSIKGAVRVRLVEGEQRLARAASGFRAERLMTWLARRDHDGRRAQQHLTRLARQRWGQKLEELDGRASRVRALDPSRVLARGYSLSFDENGKLVRSTDDVPIGGRLRTQLRDGFLHSQVNGVEKNVADAEQGETT